MGRWCAERTSAEALDILGKAKIPAGPVLKPQQALDDPHVQAMGFFQRRRLSRPAAARADGQDAGMAVRNARLDPPPRADAWRTHRPILAELGYDEAEIAALREKGVI